MVTLVHETVRVSVMRVSGLAVTVTDWRPCMDDRDYRQCNPETDVPSWPSMLLVWDAFENHPQGVHAPAREIAQVETGGRANADIRASQLDQSQVWEAADIGGGAAYPLPPDAPARTSLAF